MKESLNRGPDITFLYIQHTRKNIRDVLTKVKDFDVILLETVGLNLLSLNLLESTIAGIAGEKNRLKKFLGALPFYSRQKRDLGCALIVQAIETKKEFHFIDVLNPSPEYSLTKNSSEEYRQALDLFINGEPSRAFSVLEKSLKLYAEAGRERDKIVIQQVDKMAELFAHRWSGKRVCAVEGIMHSETFRIYKNTHPNGSTSVSLLYPRLYLPPSAEIIRRAEWFPGQKTKKTDYIRSLICEALIAPQILAKLPPEKANHLLGVIIRKMPEENINVYWSRILEAEKKSKKTGDKKGYLAEIVKISHEICDPYLKKAVLNG